MTTPDTVPEPEPGEPGGRIPNETDRAYAAWCVYRDMGAQRSLGKLNSQLGRSEGYIGQLEKWSRTNNWVARAKEWDNHVDSHVREDQVEEIRKMRARHAAQAQEYLTALAQPAKVFLEKLARDDPTLLKELHELPAGRLVELIAKCARVFGGPAKVEMISRGVDPGEPGALDVALGDGGSSFRILIEDATEDEDEEGSVVPDVEREVEAE